MVSTMYIYTIEYIYDLCSSEVTCLIDVIDNPGYRYSIELECGLVVARVHNEQQVGSGQLSIVLCNSCCARSRPFSTSCTM